MIKGLFALESELRRVHEIEMPRQSDLYILRDLLPTLSKFDCHGGPSKKGLSFGSARGTIDELLEDYPEPNHYLAQDASIVQNPLFESAIVKVLDTKSRTAKYTLTDRRKRMGPILFEALFLKTKREFWDS
ncbi:hypothetical protein PC128_g10802 [Phytophthora cactorum]|nr:hypothetical protein PC128_g10802 [Phytophthora cactorum]